MPEFTSYDPGLPSWVDHATKDLEASNAFYGALFRLGGRRPGRGHGSLHPDAQGRERPWPAT